MVPPALGKVGKNVLKRDLNHLKGKGNECDDAPVADDKHLRQVTQRVREQKLIKNSMEPLVGVLWGGEAAVVGVGALGQVSPQLRVDEAADHSNRRNILENQEDAEAHVEDANGEEGAPNSGVGAHHLAVGEVNHAKGHKRPRYGAEAELDVRLNRVGRVRRREVGSVEEEERAHQRHAGHDSARLV